MATRKDIRDIDIDEEVVEVTVTGNSGLPVNRNNSAMQMANQEFEGLDSIASFMPYFILDGSELLNKTDNSIHQTIEVVLEGGKPIWQLWDLNSNLVAESFNGSTDVNGRLMNELLAEERHKSSEPEKVKIQARYDIYFDWEYADDGVKLTKISLSPASKFAFAEYAKELTKKGKKLNEVHTAIGAERTVSKQGFRYSKATFTAVGVK